MSGSSLDGLDIAFVELQAKPGQWDFDIVEAECIPYPEEWIGKLQNAINLNAKDYLLLHAEYGHYLGKQVNAFMDKYGLAYKVALISSHGHTSFHVPPYMTAQLGDGAAIPAETGLPVVTDLRALDVALGGQGAPIVPVGEKLLLGDYDYFLNLGGIANISFTENSKRVAFDVCPANRVLNMLANEAGKEFDEGGRLASTGKVDDGLLNRLNELDYYSQPYPKSLANDFGTDIVYPIIKNAGIGISDGLGTYIEHIVVQIKKVIENAGNNPELRNPTSNLLATGGGAFNSFLIQRLKEELQALNTDVVIPDENLVKYKEALIMALIGVLRWREEYNVLSSVTGASRDSIGGALWNGQEA